ncbi:MAG: hypothetical protein IJ574_02780 [Bacilli bacterium]|nr:hypothetical protein [Bacilli bacterium]
MDDNKVLGTRNELRHINPNNISMNTRKSSEQICRNNGLNRNDDLLNKNDPMLNNRNIRESNIINNTPRINSGNHFRNPRG